MPGQGAQSLWWESTDVPTCKLRGNWVLLAPEHSYAAGSMASALILGASDRPGFIPDARYITWYDLYARRVEVFCFLFPQFPHQHCNKFRNSGEGGILPESFITNPAIMGDVLAIYGIVHAADLNGPFRPLLERRASELGWEPVVDFVGLGFLHDADDVGRIGDIAEMEKKLDVLLMRS
jgi:hypothetical protein